MADEVIGSAVLELRTDDAKFKAPIRKAHDEAKKLDRQFESIIKTQKSLAAGAAIAFAGVTAAILTSVNASNKFNAEMTKIETLVGVARGQVQGWTQDLLDLSVETARVPQELAEALFVVTSAGERGAGALDVLERAAKAAASGLGEARDIARTVTSAIQAYGRENLDAARATDILVATVREGNLEASELAGSLGRVLGIAAQVGVTFDDVGAFVATFTRLGVSASEAVTGLRGVLNAVIRGADQTEDALAGVGMSVAGLREAIQERGLAAALIELVQAFDGNDQALSKVIPEVEALAGVLATAGAQGEQFEQITRNIADSQGILDEAFDRTRQTGEFAMNQLLATIEALRIEVGDLFAPVVVEATEALTGALNVIRGMDEDTQSLVRTVGSGAAGAVGSFAALATGTWLLVTALRALRTATLGAMGPAGWLVLAAQAALSLAAGFRAAGAAADAAFGSILATGDIQTLQDELSKVNDEIEESNERMRLMEQAGLREGDFLGGSITNAEKRSTELLEKRVQIEERIAEVKTEQAEAERRAAEADRLAEEAAKNLNNSTAGTRTNAEAASAAFKEWQEAIAAVDANAQAVAQNMRIVQRDFSAHADQAEFVRDLERERVISLEREIGALGEKIQITDNTLDLMGAEGEERDHLLAQIQAFRAGQTALNHDLNIARDTLRLAERDDVYGAIARQAQLFRVQLESGDRSTTDLIGAAFDLLKEVEGLEDGTLQWNQALVLVRDVMQEIVDKANELSNVRATLEAPMTAVMPGTNQPIARPTVERLQSLFDRLQLQRRAGVVGDQEFMDRVSALSESLFDLTGGVDGLKNASDPVLQLFAGLEGAMSEFFKKPKEENTKDTGEAAEALRLLNEQFELEVKKRELVNVAIDTFASRLGEADQALGDLARSILNFDAETGQFKLDEVGIFASAIQFATNALIDLATAGNEARAQMDRPPDPGTDVLGVAQAFTAFEDLDKNMADRRNELATLIEQERAISERTVGGAAAGAALGGLLAFFTGGLSLLLGAAIGGVAGGVGARSSAEDTIGPEIARTEEEIAELEDAIKGARVELVKALGTSIDDIAGDFRSAFSADTAQDFTAQFGDNLEQTTKGALISAFLAGEVMEPLLGNLSNAITAAVLDGTLTAQEKASIASIGQEIIGQSSLFFEAMQELDLGFGELGDESDNLKQRFGALARNVPTGFKIDVARFQSAIPTFHNGGVMPHDGLANLRKGERISTPEGSESLELTINIQNAFGADVDRIIEEGVAKADRKLGLSRSGTIHRSRGRG